MADNNTEVTPEKDNEPVKMEFKFEIDLAEYAKRFGITLPDDSPDALIGDDGDVKEGEGESEDSACSNAVAEDGAISIECRSPNPATCRNHGNLRKAKDAVKLATDGVTTELLTERIDNILNDRIIDIRLKDGERDMMKGAAIDFFVRYSKMLLPLSTNGYMCFVPGESTVERNEGDTVNSWAEYAIHAVTNDNIDPETGKHYRVYAQKKIELVNPAIPEIVQDDKVIVDDRRGKVIFVKNFSEGMARIVAKPMEKGNLWADLGDVTNIFTSKVSLPDIPVPLRKAAEARGAERELPLTPGKLSSTKNIDIIAQDEIPCQWWLDAVAEDALVSYNANQAGVFAGKCKATLAQCKAKNPMTCPYHGAKVIAGDIETTLRAAGVKGAVEVELLGVTSSGGKQWLSVQAKVLASAQDQQAVVSAMNNFFKNPGVAGSTTMTSFSGGSYESPFDIDILDPGAQAKWGVGQSAPAQQTQQTTQTPAKPQKVAKPKPAPVANPQQQQTPVQPPVSAPEPPAPTPAPAPSPVATSSSSQHGGKMHPPAPPKVVKPTKPDFTQQDLDDLVAARDRLEPLARCLNGRVGNLANLQNSSRYDALKDLPDDTAFYKRLDDLTKNKDAKVSAAAKHLKQIADNIAASKAVNWTTNAGMIDDQATFASKLPSVAVVPEPPKSAAEKRETEIAGLKQVKAAKDPKAPKTAAAAMESLHKDMEDMENSIGDLDDAIANEKDPDAKKALQDVLAEVEGAYFDADKAYKIAQAEVNQWQSKQHVMQGSIKDTMDALTARGEKISPFMKNWQAQIDRTRKRAAQNVANEAGITPAQADAFAKANCQSLYERACKGEVSIGSIGDYHYALNMLDGGHPFGATLGAYPGIAKNCFGAKPNDDLSSFCKAIGCKYSDFDDWWGGSCCCFVDPKKAVLGINAHLYSGDSHYGANKGGSNLVLMTDANASVIDHVNPSKGIATQDLTNETTDDFMLKSGLESGNEIHVLGGITLQNCAAIKFYTNKLPTFTQTQIANIRKYGIKIYDYLGNLVNV